ETLASLRAIPNLDVYRPADAVETAECWALALACKSAPAAIALTRQGVPTVRTEHTDENLSAKGAYVLREAGGERQATILATGSEVSIALTAHEQLAAEGVHTAVVSMPCWEAFDVQDDIYRASVLGTAPRVAIEAAVQLGWERYIGETGAFIGMRGFGASAPAGDLYEHFGLTADAVADAVKARI
ncbi:MAG: transketolase C-terminal domain-containing protein, partial [Rhodospirillales bacterium]|nr:transketolase C-terminal domain-containing protein [Rhodospirillales bacterium]